jgi:hypothetical protein
MSVRHTGTGRVSSPPRHAVHHSAAPAPSASVRRLGTVLMRVSPRASPRPGNVRFSLLTPPLHCARQSVAPAPCASLRCPEQPC